MGMVTHVTGMAKKRADVGPNRRTDGTAPGITSLSQPGAGLGQTQGQTGRCCTHVLNKSLLPVNPFSKYLVSAPDKSAGNVF